MQRDQNNNNKKKNIASQQKFFWSLDISVEKKNLSLNFAWGSRKKYTNFSGHNKQKMSFQLKNNQRKHLKGEGKTLVFKPNKKIFFEGIPTKFC